MTPGTTMSQASTYVDSSIRTPESTSTDIPDYFELGNDPHRASETLSAGGQTTVATPLSKQGSENGVDIAQSDADSLTQTQAEKSELEKRVAGQLPCPYSPRGLF